MNNAAPIKIVMMHVQSSNLAAATELAESSFCTWSESQVGITVNDVRIEILPETRPQSITWHAVITIVYSLLDQQHRIQTLMSAINQLMTAWSAWKQREQGDQKLALVDMQVQLSQPLSFLHDSWQALRSW